MKTTMKVKGIEYKLAKKYNNYAVMGKQFTLAQLAKEADERVNKEELQDASEYYQAYQRELHKVITVKIFNLAKSIELDADTNYNWETHAKMASTHGVWTKVYYNNNMESIVIPPVCSMAKEPHLYTVVEAFIESETQYTIDLMGKRINRADLTEAQFTEMKRRMDILREARQKDYKWSLYNEAVRPMEAYKIQKLTNNLQLINIKEAIDINNIYALATKVTPIFKHTQIDKAKAYFDKMTITIGKYAKAYDIDNVITSKEATALDYDNKIELGARKRLRHDEIRIRHTKKFYIKDSKGNIIGSTGEHIGLDKVDEVKLAKSELKSMSKSITDYTEIVRKFILIKTYMKAGKEFLNPDYDICPICKLPYRKDAVSCEVCGHTIIDIETIRTNLLEYLEKMLRYPNAYLGATEIRNRISVVKAMSVEELQRYYELMSHNEQVDINPEWLYG